MANRIRALREEINMTQIRLSTELEVSQETISAYETGRHNPSFALLARMSDLFHVRMDYIIGLSDVRKPLAEMALSWVLKDGDVTSVLIGASKPEQILDNIKCIENTHFTAEELAQIDAASL